MIIDNIMTLLHLALQWFISVRPAWDLVIDPSVGQLVGHALSYDWVFPIHEGMIVTATACGGFATAVGLKWGKQVIDWIAAIIP